MKLQRKTIIENIHRLNYDKQSSEDWIETLNRLASLDYKQLIEYYIDELKYNIAFLSNQQK